VPEPRRLDAVLPLRAADCDRAEILFRSLEALFAPLGTCYVVAPDEDVRAVHPCVPRGRYLVVPESDVIPEIGRFRTTARLRAKLRLIGPPIHGWYVQQLVKLAIAERIGTPFYLTLDADVICVRPTRYEDLVVDGRALVQTTPPNHPEWNDDAERVLGLPRSGRQWGVTPAVLSVDAVRALAAHLGGTTWRKFLLKSLPWTEYALYHTFLEQTGLFDRYHAHGGHDAIYSNCVWMESEFEDWDPAATRTPFSVVQSATRIPPERVAAKLSTAASSGRRSHARSLASAE
jgi:hypothetical protein